MWRAFLAVAGIALAGVGVGHVRAEGEDSAEPIGTVIGIDLGTTYSCVGVFKGGRVEIIANDQGNRITPSYVAWDSNGERLIGDAAKNQATVNPETTVFDVKRLIGRQFGDKSVQADMKLFPFKIVNKDNKPNVQVRKDSSHEGTGDGDCREDVVYVLPKSFWFHFCMSSQVRSNRIYVQYVQYTSQRNCSLSVAPKSRVDAKFTRPSITQP